MMTTRLKGDICCCTLQLLGIMLIRLTKGKYFGMGLSCLIVKTFADDLIIFDNDAADIRIGTGGETSFFSQLNGA